MDATTVLSAAHCFHDGAGTTVVVAGSHKGSDNTGVQVKYTAINNNLLNFMILSQLVFCSKGGKSLLNFRMNKQYFICIQSNFTDSLQNKTRFWGECEQNESGSFWPKSAASFVRI